jgi:hypothetical protein
MLHASTSHWDRLKHHPQNNQSLSKRRGQALAEFVIILIVLITLITGVTTIANLCLKQEHLQRDTRLKAGEAALSRTTQGWVNTDHQPESRADIFHQINSFTRLSDYTPALPSKLPISNYTLEARQRSDGDLGLEETTLSQTFLLDEAFIRLIYQKGTITFRSQLTFPATSGIWK